MTASSSVAPSPIVTEALELLGEREDLGRELAGRVLQFIMAGEVCEAQMAAFLMGLRTKGETAEEIAGLAEAMRSSAVRVPLREEVPLVDTCGTGGDRLGTFNISTTAAFVVAGAGARVAKHGNRGASSRSGSADVLEALGVRIDLTPQDVAVCIEEVGIGFMFAPAHHIAMGNLMPTRRSLGIRTVFNFLGPLTNPAGARRQLVGVSSRRYLPVLAGALHRMGCERALVVHGEDGLDEVSIGSATLMVEATAEGVGSIERVEPEMFGMTRHPLQELAGGLPEENAGITREVLSGGKGAAMDVVVMNAGAALYVSGLAGSIGEGVALARDSIESGRAEDKLCALIEATSGAR